MQASRPVSRKRNLLLCFDAFGTLFAPNVPIPTAYARAAARHGIDCGNPEKAALVGPRFKEAFKAESKRNPNYGRATGLGAEKWWSNIIHDIFKSFLKPDQKVPQALISELLQRYSTQEGYDMYPDVQDFFKRLQNYRSGKGDQKTWPFDKTIVGIITNSDNRIPGILQSFGLKINPLCAESSPDLTIQSSPQEDINFVVLSYDVGHEKPDRRIFDAATNLLSQMLSGKQGPKVEDFEELYVGDELEKDYEGARAAGWNAVLLDRSGSEKNSEGSGLEYVEVDDKEGNKKRVLRMRSLEDLYEWPNVKDDQVDVLEKSM